MADNVTPIGKNKATIVIRKRKKAAHHGAHGGAWKVAYADFVTAMMAFFLVMWLLGSDEETRAAVAKYFNNPSTPGAWRPELKDADINPLGNLTGAGENVLKGDQGQVSEDLVERPKPLLQRETGKEGVVNLDGLIATEDMLWADQLKFSLNEDKLFSEGGTAFTPAGLELLKRMGSLSARYKGRLQINGLYNPRAGDAEYELQLSRAVAVKELMVAKRWAPEDLVRTQVLRRDPAAEMPRRLEFVFFKAR
jgi:chemotaxis protein MotB